MRLTVELTSEEEIVLIRNETLFDYCTWEESDQLEEIIEYTFEDADVEGVQEASESRLLAQCKSAEDAELVLTMFNPPTCYARGAVAPQPTGPGLSGSGLYTLLGRASLTNLSSAAFIIAPLKR
jgi:hypothetical protein